MSNDDGMVRLPDGSGAFIASMPLPKDHWVFSDEREPPPMTLRCGTSNKIRKDLEVALRVAARWAVRGATMRGTEKDFDPDALVQNVIIGALGYFTPNGLGKEDWENPEKPPMEIESIIR